MLRREPFCVVPGCEYEGLEDEFIQFPEDKVTRNLWAISLQKKEFIPIDCFPEPDDFICMRHFQCKEKYNTKKNGAPRKYRQRFIAKDKLKVLKYARKFPPRQACCMASTKFGISSKRIRKWLKWEEILRMMPETSRRTRRIDTYFDKSDCQMKLLTSANKDFEKSVTEAFTKEDKIASRNDVSMRNINHESGTMETVKNADQPLTVEIIPMESENNTDQSINVGHDTVSVETEKSMENKRNKTAMETKINSVQSDQNKKLETSVSVAIETENITDRSEQNETFSFINAEHSELRVEILYGGRYNKNGVTTETEDDKLPTWKEISRRLNGTYFLGEKLNAVVVGENQKEFFYRAIKPPLLWKLRHRDSIFEYFTGFKNYPCFMFFYCILGPPAFFVIIHDKLSPAEQLFLTIIKLRNRRCIEELAYLFGISKIDVSVIFKTWMRYMSKQLPMVFECQVNDSWITGV